MEKNDDIIVLTAPGEVPHNTAEWPDGYDLIDIKAITPSITGASNRSEHGRIALVFVRRGRLSFTHLGHNHRG